MPSPWLQVPLEDYEGHMNDPAVQQLAALADLFGEAFHYCQPPSVAIFGIAGGNGLDRADPRIARRIVGLDINPTYLDRVRERFPHVEGLELHCMDLAGQPITFLPVHLVHAALVFEHAGTGRCLDNALAAVSPGGSLSVVLQLPSAVESGVSKTSFASLQSLSADFAMIDPVWLTNTLAGRNFRLAQETRRALPSGKAFWLGIFGRN